MDTRGQKIVEIFAHSLKIWASERAQSIRFSAKCMKSRRQTGITFREQTKNTWKRLVTSNSSVETWKDGFWTLGSWRNLALSFDHELHAFKMAASFTMIDNFLTQGGVGKRKRESEAKSMGHLIGEGRVGFLIISEIQNFINREWCAQHSQEKRIEFNYLLYRSLVPKKKSGGNIFHPSRK